MFIPAILILPRVIGITGVQMAQPLVDILSFAMCVPFQAVIFKKELNDRLKLRRTA